MGGGDQGLSAPGTIPRRRPAPLLAVAFLLVTACAGDRELRKEDADHQLPSAATRFFAVAYDQMSERYAEPVTPAALAESGLGNLGKIDPRISVRRSGERIEVTADHRLAVALQAPPAEDTYRWARLTVAAINAGREHSLALREASSNDVYQAVMDGAVRTLDQHSRYSSPEGARDNRALREGFGGIGVTIDGESDDVRIAAVMSRSPAAAAGLQADDRIARIEGEATRGMSSRDIVRRLRGPIGAPVAIDVMRMGNEGLLAFTIVRALVVPQTVTYRRDGDIAHIKITGFNGRTAERTVDALLTARREIGRDIKGVVLDLRGNLGGLFEQSVTVADIFLDHGRIVTTRSRHRAAVQIVEASPGDPGENLPVVVLINGNSASAAEIVAAALQDNGRALAIGTTSFGKGSVQTVIGLPNEGELAITWAHYYSPAGYTPQNLGVNPAICTAANDDAVAPVIEAVRAGRAAPAVSMAEWQATDYRDKERSQALRARCAPNGREREIDYEIAKRLLQEPGLYSSALRSAQVTARVN